MDLINDEFYMGIALQLAHGATGQTGVNPMVGCVIVKEGAVIGLGAHLKMGTEHAEVHALNMAGEHAAGSTVYVTLEPCSHHGRTPPCSDKLIANKVARVVVACTDPNPRVAGAGIAKLKAHGIEVKLGVLEREAIDLNEKFNKYITTRLPFVSLKTASTLDGKIASKNGDSRWITNDQSRAYVHTLRHQHQAIMVGVGTVLIDDPLLTARLTVAALNPIRIIVDSTLRTPPNAAVLQQAGQTIVLTTTQASLEKSERLREMGAELLTAGDGPKVDLKQAMQLLAEREIGSILLEGGGRLNGAMLEQKLIDKCYLFYAAKIIGGDNAPSNFSFDGFAKMSEAIWLDRLKIEQFGHDLCMIGYPQYEGGGS
ncbi:MAG: 5-amino-6-(5-phosphoribosylamino)uracil reductase [Bacilli bacterium]|jgi:diaminohydroxyphosphoribosylaminopyrimidine deaminase/5-amino-6-(5-phosphoribosylamino)uracil reductase|nr:5-amino-6-(5-phosphoribosylamino)uracil reductase [Bacilli bacterium]